MKTTHQPNQEPTQDPTEGTLRGEEERFTNLGRDILKKLGVSDTFVGNIREQVRLTMLGQLNPPPGTPPADWPELLASLRFAAVNAVSQFPTISALADKVALAFSAFDSGLDPEHQSVALGGLDKASHRSAVTLALLKARDVEDPYVLNNIALVGRLEPLLEPLAAAYMLHSEKSEAIREPLESQLGAEKYEELMNLEVTDRGRLLDPREILNSMAPHYGTELPRTKLIELGTYWSDAENAPQVSSVDDTNALPLLLQVMQRASRDVEFGCCLAGALIATHQQDLIRLGFEKTTDAFKHIDPELASMFQSYFERVKSTLTPKS